MSAEIEVDESYFVAKRVRGKCGRWAGKKTSMFLLCDTHLATASKRGLAKLTLVEFIWLKEEISCFIYKKTELR